MRRPPLRAMGWIWLMAIGELVIIRVSSININIEKPNSLDYFKWVQKYVEEAQKENPEIIREVIEKKKPKLEELQKIPPSEEEETPIEEEIPSEEVQKKLLFDGIKEGSSKFNDYIINIYSDQFEKWMDDEILFWR